jgi:hypothetical protein
MILLLQLNESLEGATKSDSERPLIKKAREVVLQSQKANQASHETLTRILAELDGL